MHKEKEKTESEEQGEETGEETGGGLYRPRQATSAQIADATTRNIVGNTRTTSE